MAQHSGQRHDEYDVAAQRDDQRFCALAKAFQCTGRGGGYGRNHKAQTDDAQGSLADGDGFGVGGEQLHQRAGSEQADDRARSHDGSTHDEGEFVELFHAGVLFGTVIVANERAHTLHDAVGGQIQEGLQLVVNAQHHHVALGKARQQAVQEGDQQRGQGQIEDGRHADGIQFAVQCGIRAQAAAAQSDRQLSTDVNEKVNAQAQQLADAGGKGRTRNAHGRHRAKAEDQDGVQKDVAHTAKDQRRHSHLHAAHGLKHLFKGQCRHVDGGKQEYDGGVGDAGCDQACVAGEPAQKARHDDNADNGDENAVHQAQRHTVGGGSLGLFVVARAKVQCDHGIDADAEADGDGVGKILDREHQRQRSHGVFADAGHKQAVYNVVQTVHQHGNNIGQRHGYQQRQHRFFFHKGLVHSVCIAPVEKRNELLQPRNRQGETARKQTQTQKSHTMAFLKSLCGEK